MAMHSERSSKSPDSPAARSDQSGYPEYELTIAFPDGSQKVLPGPHTITLSSAVTITSVELTRERTDGKPRLKLKLT